MKNRMWIYLIGLLSVLTSTTCSLANTDTPALKDVFAKAFLIGGALNDRLVSGKDPNAAALAERHFNSITPEDVMKWALIHPEPNRYDFAAADRLVEFGQKNKQFIVGHCLVWHTQVPAWTFRDSEGNNLTREALLSRMKDHIQIVVGRYKGKVKGWDVVNEALNDSGTLRQSPWLRIIGEDYIEKAFQYAHEADPNAELYYNDYNLDTMKGKCDAAVVLVKGLQSKGIRIDGVGIQLHGGLTYPRKETLDYALTTLATTGLKVMVTELDIRTQTRGYRGADVSLVNRQNTNDPNAAAEETQTRLAEKYAEIFSVLLKHKKAVSRVTFWGVYDATSWIGGSPLLFDRKCQPKLAYFAVVKTAQGNK